jgi:hypothetical protein
MEHSSPNDSSSISSLFFYPMQSLVYCGALRFVSIKQMDPLSGQPQSTVRFVPLDSEYAQMSENIKNPPLFVVFLKGIDPNDNNQIIECHVFVMGLRKTAMKLVESCQQAFGMSKTTVNEFYKKYGNVPVVYCMRDDEASGGKGSNKRVVVKIFDLNGYFYAIDKTPIDWWQLFETNSAADAAATAAAVAAKSKIYDSSIPLQMNTLAYNNVSLDENKHAKQVDLEGLYSSVGSPLHHTLNPNNININNKSLSGSSTAFIDPYEKTDNLVSVEKRVDPVTGQNIYVRWLADKSPPKQTPIGYDMMQNLYDEQQRSSNEQLLGTPGAEKLVPPILLRQEKTPSPIIVEKYIKTKSPQVIIKEIHVHEPVVNAFIFQMLYMF